LFFPFPEDLFRRDGEIIDPNPGGVEDGVSGGGSEDFDPGLGAVRTEALFW
jgi:hypothetical protein